MNGHASPALDLQGALDRIRELPNTEAVYDFSDDLCVFAGVDKAMIYRASTDGSVLLTPPYRGLTSFRELRLPITNPSIPGFVAGIRKAVIFRDVYDDHELAQHSPELRFLKAVDQKTGYRTRQMLVVPALDGDSGELLGVVQLINTKSGSPFSAETEELVGQIVRALAVKFLELRNGG